MSAPQLLTPKLAKEVLAVGKEIWDDAFVTTCIPPPPSILDFPISATLAALPSNVYHMAHFSPFLWHNPLKPEFMTSNREISKIVDEKDVADSSHIAYLCHPGPNFNHC